jgi:hypothetical protein
MRAEVAKTSPKGLRAVTFWKHARTGTSFYNFFFVALCVQLAVVDDLALARYTRMRLGVSSSCARRPPVSFRILVFRPVGENCSLAISLRAPCRHLLVELAKKKVDRKIVRILDKTQTRPHYMIFIHSFARIFICFCYVSAHVFFVQFTHPSGDD